jgi:hypothetical protein
MPWLDEIGLKNYCMGALPQQHSSSPLCKEANVSLPRITPMDDMKNGAGPKLLNNPSQVPSVHTSETMVKEHTYRGTL